MVGVTTTATASPAASAQLDWTRTLLTSLRRAAWRASEKLFRRVAGLLTATSGAWLPDPSARHELRWWDGSRWTENVRDSGRPGVDTL